MIFDQNTNFRVNFIFFSDNTRNQQNDYWKMITQNFLTGKLDNQKQNDKSKSNFLR